MEDTGDHFALFRLAGQNRMEAVPLRQRTPAVVQAQVGLAGLAVRAVALKTLVGEDRLDVPGVVDRFLLSGRGRSQGKGGDRDGTGNPSAHGITYREFAGLQSTG